MSVGTAVILELSKLEEMMVEEYGCGSFDAQPLCCPRVGQAIRPSETDERLGE